MQVKNAHKTILQWNVVMILFDVSLSHINSAFTVITFLVSYTNVIWI